MVARQKIRAYLARALDSVLDLSKGVEVTRTISKTYSGFVHAALPQIMDMYGGDPPRFHMSGMRGTERHIEYQDDLWNYFYRGLAACSCSAKAFGDEPLFKLIHDFTREFEKRSGKDYEGEDRVARTGVRHVLENQRLCVCDSGATTGGRSGGGGAGRSESKHPRPP